MAGRDAVRSLRFAFFSSRTKIAVAASVAVHAALVYGVVRMSGRAEAPPLRVSPAVVWLGEWPRSRRQPEPETEAPAEESDPAAESVPEPAPEPIPDLEPEAAEDAVSQEPMPAPAVGDARDGDPAPKEASEPGSAARGIDWEEERRRAIRELAEESELEASYRTFSLDDLLDEAEPPPEEPGPSRSIFTPGGGGAAPPAVLPRGQARTKVGRFISELCHALTGGFGIGFQGRTFASACAESYARSDLFEHLKPEYLRRRPEDFVNPRSVAARPAPTAVEPAAATP